MLPEVICSIELMGECAKEVREGKALPMAVLVYYPEQNRLVMIGTDTRTAEETDAILRQFIDFSDE